MYDSIYTLGHGFWIKANETNFDLGLDEKIILANCSKFSYVYEKIIVVKTQRLIIVFSGVPLTNNGNKNVKILASFSDSNEKVFTNVMIDNICYTIDYNCQITSHPLPKTIFPNSN